MADTTLFHDDLTAMVIRIFQGAGLSPLNAAALARVIVAGEGDACKSHGIYRIEGCLRTIKAGKVVPDAVPQVHHDDSAVVRVNAGGGFSNAAFEAGAPVLAERCRTTGIAAMVINDCTHFAALWPEIEALTEMGLAAMAMCPSYASVAPSGGTDPLMGTNPFAFGWPREGGDPYVFDFATSVAARGDRIAPPRGHAPARRLGHRTRWQPDDRPRSRPRRGYAALWRAQGIGHLDHDRIACRGDDR